MASWAACCWIGAVFSSIPMITSSKAFEVVLPKLKYPISQVRTHMNKYFSNTSHFSRLSCTIISSIVRGCTLKVYTKTNEHMKNKPTNTHTLYLCNYIQIRLRWSTNIQPKCIILHEFLQWLSVAQGGNVVTLQNISFIRIKSKFLFNIISLKKCYVDDINAKE